jgi:TatD DNase family protein
MAFVDAHCHLTHERFASDADAAVHRARAAGLSTLVTCGGNRADTERALALADRHPGLVRVAASLEPYHSASASWKAELDFLAATAPRLAALGETGLDATYPAPLDRQEAVFRAHLELAREHKLAVVVHARGTEERTLALLSRAGVPWVWHHFLKARLLPAALDAGAVLSLPTLKSRELDRISARAPLERVVCETDAPYAWSAGRNEPANVRYAYERLAREREMELDEVARAVEANARRVFRFG